MPEIVFDRDGVAVCIDVNKNKAVVTMSGVYPKVSIIQVADGSYDITCDNATRGQRALNLGKGSRIRIEVIP